MNSLSFVLASLTTGWITLGSAAVLRLTSSRREAAGRPVSPVSVLKPLCGADPSLRENLESFFVQDHPSYELIFGVERADDPAIPVVEDLIAQHPTVRARIVVHVPPRGENPKVRNLRGIVGHASFDLVLISDSNVRAPRGYLTDAVRELESHPDNGLVTNLFVGSGGGTLGAALEAVQLTGFCTSGAALPTVVGDAAVIGKSMLFSRSTFESLGGFARVADVLAEDYVIGKMYQHAGLRVVVAPTVLDNVLGKLTVKQFFDRQLRWSMLRARLRPAAFVLEPLTSPLAVLPFAWSIMGASSLAWMAALLFVRDAVPWIAMKGLREVHKPLLLSWVREVFALAIWVSTPFKRHASWRGHRVRVGAGTMLFHESA
ncbi:MAG: ceramide glucosyltransferase [Polyangiaceae bacterium]